MQILQSIYQFNVFILDTVCLAGLNVHISVQRHPQYVACPLSRAKSKSTDRSTIVHSACIVVWRQLVITRCS